MGKLKAKVIEIMEIAESLCDDFDIGYSDFSFEDIEYVAMEAQVDVDFVCEVLGLDLNKVGEYQ
jgi:hypothetical protein